jgi:hypothetical protein
MATASTMDDPMNTPTDGHAGMALLEATLETYGGDRTRWPADVRHKLSGILANNDAAERLIAEAVALDRLLDMAPAVSPERRHALAVRISAEARKGQPAAAAARVQPSRSRWREGAYAGIALAASLMLGLFAGSNIAGSNSTLAPAIQSIATDAGWEPSATSGQVAANDESDGLANEDLL